MTESAKCLSRVLPRRLAPDVAHVVAPVVAPVVARGPLTVSAASDYAVLANDGTGGTDNDFDGEAAGTAVGRGLGVRARVGGGRHSPASAFASSSIRPSVTRRGGASASLSGFGVVRRRPARVRHRRER